MRYVYAGLVNTTASSLSSRSGWRKFTMGRAGRFAASRVTARSGSAFGSVRHGPRRHLRVLRSSHATGPSLRTSGRRTKISTACSAPACMDRTLTRMSLRRWREFSPCQSIANWVASIGRQDRDGDRWQAVAAWEVGPRGRVGTGRSSCALRHWSWCTLATVWCLDICKRMLS